MLRTGVFYRDFCTISTRNVAPQIYMRSLRSRLQVLVKWLTKSRGLPTTHDFAPTDCWQCLLRSMYWIDRSGYWMPKATGMSSALELLALYSLDPSRNSAGAWKMNEFQTWSQIDRNIETISSERFILIDAEFWTILKSWLRISSRQ